MLKLTLHPGDFIDIGEDIRVVFSGGSANNIHLLVDAPREMNIARNTAQKKSANNNNNANNYTQEDTSGNNNGQNSTADNGTAHNSVVNNNTAYKGTAGNNATGNSRKPSKYYAEPKLSAQAQKEIVEIIKQEKKNRRNNLPATWEN